MTYRRIISPALLRQQQNTTNCTKRENDGAVNRIKAHHILSSVVVTILVTYSKEVRVDDNNPYWQINVYVIIISVLTVAIIFSRRKPKRKDIEAIVLYPLGIQLGTIRLDDIYSNSADIKVTPQLFLHRDTIIDCVVTELVYSYKVQSTVILRTKQHHYECKKVNPKPADTDYETTAKDDGITKTLTRTHKARESINNLIHLFSDFEMTYLECLTIRSQINTYLKLSDEFITITRSTIS